MQAQRSAGRRIKRWFSEDGEGLRFRFTDPYDASIAMITLNNYVPRNKDEVLYKERAEEAMLKELCSTGNLIRGSQPIAGLMKLRKEVRKYEPSNDRLRDMLRVLDLRISEEQCRLYPEAEPVGQ